MYPFSVGWIGFIPVMMTKFYWCNIIDVDNNYFSIWKKYIGAR